MAAPHPFTRADVRQTTTDWAPHYDATHAFELSRRSLEAIQEVFGEVQVHCYWMGMISIAVADTKYRSSDGDAA
jgi:hypothetical protein